VAQLKRRMIVPDLFAHPYLMPATKRLLFAGMLCLAEDSGCLEWNAGLLKALVLPLEDATVPDVKAWMDELEHDGLAWSYSAESRTWAYLPDFHRWQGRLGRWGAPETVPLPSGIVFTPSPVKERAGSGLYDWPESREALDRKALQELDPESPKRKEGTALDLKEGASTQPATSALPADDAEEIPLLIQRLGKERTDKADRLARGHALERNVELDQRLRRFYLEAELEKDATEVR